MYEGHDCDGVYICTYSRAGEGVWEFVSNKILNLGNEYLSGYMGFICWLAYLGVGFDYFGAELMSWLIVLYTPIPFTTKLRLVCSERVCVFLAVI